MPDQIDPLQETRNWLETVVVGLNLCPFAAPVVRGQGLTIELCEQRDHEAMLAAVLQQLDILQQTEQNDIATSLLVFSQALDQFEEFWAFVELANELLQQAGLEGLIQIASFHPQYCFEGEPEGDVSHFTNRSPYPTLHFIRESDMSRALAQHPSPEQIPANNIRRLRQLGKPALLRLLQQQ